MKKILALVLALMLVLASLSAFADYTISVTKPANATTTHTYNVYQIFTGVPENDSLTKIQYGSSHPSFTTVDAENNFVPKTVLDSITDARTYAKSLTLGEAVGTVTEGGDALTVAAGYYLLKDISYTDATEDDAFSAIIVKVVNSAIEITPKRVKPSVEKEVQDEADDAEAGAVDGWGKTADHEIGETFQFRLTATLPASEDYAQYPTYMVRFNDTMSAGVTFEKIDSVTVDGVTVTDYASTATAGQAGGSWTLTIADLKTISGVDLTDGADVVVVYSAHLNKAAEVKTESGTTENQNKVTLTYSNNPDATGEGGTDTTEEHFTWVFTYGNTGTKTDATGAPLAGAKFQLHKDSATGAIVPLYQIGTDYYVYDADKADEYTGGAVAPENKMETTDAGAGVFNIKGLDIGTYVLVETDWPDGYVQASDTTFTITATHAPNESGVGYVDLSGSTVSETIVNYTGSTLPETGGIGTTIFYIAGSILVLAAVVLLVTKRRMNAEK